MRCFIGMPSIYILPARIARILQSVHKMNNDIGMSFGLCKYKIIELSKGKFVETDIFFGNNQVVIEMNPFNVLRKTCVIAMDLFIHKVTTIKKSLNRVN